MKPANKNAMTDTLSTLINARSFDCRTALLFGHCSATEEMADYLLGHNVCPSAILDNSASKQGLSYRDIPIEPPELIKQYNAENSIVLIASRFFADMSAQLRRFDYDGEIVRVADYNSFAVYSLSGETFESQKARMLRGTLLLERIRTCCPKQHLIVCPNNALGDVYWAMAFLPHYCKKHGIREIAAVVTGDGCRQVADMFGAENTTVLDLAEMDELVQALIYTRENNCIIAHHDRPYTDNIIKYLDRHFLSFIDYYRCGVYGLAMDIEPTAPTCLHAFSGEPGIVKDKTVIISPYAKSVVGPPDLFWEGLAGEWRDKGYHVCTSIDGREKPVKGTTPLFLPLNQMASAAEFAGCFIGLRNGLCDIVHTARCRKILVFPDCYYSTTPHKIEDFFDLPGWEKMNLTKILPQSPRQGGFA